MQETRRTIRPLEVRIHCPKCLRVPRPLTPVQVLAARQVQLTMRNPLNHCPAAAARTAAVCTLGMAARARSSEAEARHSSTATSSQGRERALCASCRNRVRSPAISELSRSSTRTHRNSHVLSHHSRSLCLTLPHALCQTCAIAAWKALRSCLGGSPSTELVGAMAAWGSGTRGGSIFPS